MGYHFLWTIQKLAMNFFGPTYYVVWNRLKDSLYKACLSAAEGQRPRNYSSCCSWIFRLIYALSTSTTVLPSIFLKYFKLSIYLAVFFLSIYQSTSSIP